jgi:hypothetical protein
MTDKEENMMWEKRQLGDKSPRDYSSFLQKALDYEVNMNINSFALVMLNLEVTQSQVEYLESNEWLRKKKQGIATVKETWGK